MSTQYKTFSNWCENLDNISESAQHTIKCVLGELKTKDFQEAEQKLAVLESLYINDHKLIDITPLMALRNITDLDLVRNEITDITPIAKLNLTFLYLWGNKITDITALMNLTNLSVLDLGNNEITDITALMNLTNLNQLELGNNEITDITALINLTNLRLLDLQSNKLTNITPLRGLTNLKALSLSGNKITDLTSLMGLTNLIYLDLSDNEITNITPLRGLTNVRRLDLSGNKIVDITPLMSLINLTNLVLSGDKIIDFSPLIALMKLRIIWNNIDLPKKYWQPVEKRSSHWLLEEPNAELRRLLIQQIGYEKITQELDAAVLDSWREYSLLKIALSSLDEEDIYLLKMTCPSSGLVHVIRVPPEMTSAYEAIAWVLGAPETFAVET